MKREIHAGVLADIEFNVLRLLRAEAGGLGLNYVGRRMQSVEDVGAAFIRGGSVGNVGGDIRDRHPRAENQGAAGITDHTANLRLKASLPEDESWCESQ